MQYYNTKFNKFNKFNKLLTFYYLALPSKTISHHEEHLNQEKLKKC